MPYIILDLEMTGSEADYHDIIEIGAILVDDNWKKISEFDTLVYPDNEETFTSAAEEIHGISLADLEDAPMAFDVIEAFEEWIRKSLNKRPQDRLSDIIICGQSVINDIAFLRYKYTELNINWSFSPKLIDLLSQTLLFYQIFDNNKIKRPKSHSLKAVADMFSFQREEETHSAIEDAELTYLCFKKYYELAGTIKLTL